MAAQQSSGLISALPVLILLPNGLCNHIYSIFFFLVELASRFAFHFSSPPTSDTKCIFKPCFLREKICFLRNCSAFSESVSEPGLSASYLYEFYPFSFCIFSAFLTPFLNDFFLFKSSSFPVLTPLIAFTSNQVSIFSLS